MLILLLELVISFGLSILVGQINGWFISPFVMEDEVKRVALWVSPFTEEALKYAASLAGFGWLYGVVFVLMELIEYAGHYSQQKSIATLFGCRVMDGNQFVWLRLRAAAMHVVTISLIWWFGVYGMVGGMIIHHVFNRLSLMAATEEE